MILYKYTKAEYLKSILENNSFKLSYPNDYNDPFDCHIDMADKDKQKCVDLIVNYYFFKEMEKIFLNKDVKLRTRDKIISVNFKLELLMTRSTIRKCHFYEPLPMVNGLVDFCMKIKKMDEDKKKIEDGKKEYIKQMEQKVNELRDSLLLCCYGKRNDSILMWSHYADSHKGICIEFESYDDIAFSEVKYSKKRIKLDIYRLTQIVLAFDYLGEKPEIKNQKTLKQLCKPLLTKSRDWRYEQEVRSIYYLKDNDERITTGKDKDGNDIFLINPGTIKKIYLGCKISEKDEATVRELAGSIIVIKMKESDTEYKVEET